MKISLRGRIKQVIKIINAHGEHLVEMSETIRKHTSLIQTLNIVTTESVCAIQLLIDKGLITREELKERRNQLLESKDVESKDVESKDVESKTLELED